MWKKAIFHQSPGTKRVKGKFLSQNAFMCVVDAFILESVIQEYLGLLTCRALLSQSTALFFLKTSAHPSYFVFKELPFLPRSTDKIYTALVIWKPECLVLPRCMWHCVRARTVIMIEILCLSLGKPGKGGTCMGVERFCPCTPKSEIWAKSADLLFHVAWFS